MDNGVLVLGRKMSPKEAITRAVEEAKKVPVEVGAIVAWDGEEISSQVVSIDDGMATCDFGGGRVERRAVADLFDVNVVRRIAHEFALGLRQVEKS